MKRNILFEHSIFLHQKTGGISKYIFNLNNYLNKKNFRSLIYSPITINQNLENKNKNNIFFIRFKKIPIFFTRIFYLINNILTLIKIFVYKPDVFHFSYYNNFFLRFRRNKHRRFRNILEHVKVTLKIQNNRKYVISLIKNI